MTIADALARGTGLLEQSSESPRADALLLLERVLERPRAWIVAHGQDRSAAGDAAQFFDLCERRAAGRPLAYVLGSAGFYGREFVVDESVLVPRPETEHLVDDAIAFIKAMPRDRAPAVLDLGTGSGAIACTIAAETPARVDAVDISAAALEVARENARRLNVADRCRFHLRRFDRTRKKRTLRRRHRQPAVHAVRRYSERTRSALVRAAPRPRRRPRWARASTGGSCRRSRRSLTRARWCCSKRLRQQLPLYRTLPPRLLRTT